MINLIATAAATATAQELPNGLVVAMGLGIVFVGLISIIIICSIMGAICKTAIKTAPAASEAAVEQIPDRQKMVAAVSAAIAEELGAEVSSIRIKSIKRV